MSTAESVVVAATIVVVAILLLPIDEGTLTSNLAREIFLFGVSAVATHQVCLRHHGLMPWIRVWAIHSAVIAAAPMGLSVFPIFVRLHLQKWICLPRCNHRALLLLLLCVLLAEAVVTSPR